jgi:hypothetical protein
MCGKTHRLDETGHEEPDIVGSGAKNIGVFAVFGGPKPINNARAIAKPPLP